MYRYFILIHFYLLSALACPSSFNFCQNKYFDAHIDQNQTLSIPLSHSQSLIYSSHRLKIKNLKSDPFLGLYLIEKDNKHAYIFTSLPADSLGIISKGETEEVQLSTAQIGLNILSKGSSKQGLGLVNDTCCSLHGIATKRGVIEKDYLRNFVLSKNGDYGDVGIRLDITHNKAVVRSIDPFYVDMQFQLNDKILFFDKYKIGSASSLMQKILFSKPDTQHQFQIERAGKRVTLSVVLGQRYGGGLLSDTYLERFGLFVDTELSISAQLEARELYIGDKIIAINGENISSIDEFRAIVMNSSDKITLLVERNGFQFL